MNKSLKNYSIDILLCIYKENKKKLTVLSKKDNKSHLLKDEIKSIEYINRIIKGLILKKYNENKISLTKSARLLTKSKDDIRDIYQDLFTQKLISSNELIETNTLEEAIDYLEIEHIIQIINSKKNILGARIATDVFDRMIFQVDEDVYNDFIKKKKLDN